MKNLITLSIAIAALIATACEPYEMGEPGRLVPLTVTEDSSLPSITVNGTQLHSEAFGNPNNPLIVAIHGGPGGDYRSILNLRNLVDDGYYVAFYDQRGCGLSQRHDKDMYTVQLYLDDLDAVIDYYKSPNQPVILAGHSWGAMIAAGYVDQNLDKVNGLILMEPGGLTWEDTEDYIERAVPLEFFTETINDALYMDQFITGSDHEVLDYKTSLLVASDYAEGNKQGNTGPIPIWRSGSVCRTASIEYAMNNSFDFTTNLAQFDTPVLFAYGELNEAYGQSWAEKVSSPFTNVELVEVVNTGHEIPYFGWDNIYPQIMNYLNTIN